MRRVPVPSLLGLAGLLPLLISCGDSSAPSAPADAQGPPEVAEAADIRPSTGIFDADSPGGNPGFHWLPPISDDEEFSGTFDASLASRLTVEVCALDGDDCAGDPVRTYTSAGSDPYETIQVATRREFYQVYLDTRASDIDPATHYRVSVMADGDLLLGYADVDVAATAGQLDAVDTDEFVGVLEGDWLAIRWRAEEGVTDVEPPVGSPPEVQITAPDDGDEFEEGTEIDFEATASDAEDGDLGADISWSSSVDGALGTGASISVTLSAGTHTITASVEDSEGASASDAISLTVTDEEPPPPPGANCSGNLVNGLNHLCELSEPGEIDQWTFEGAEGDYVAISMAEVEGDGDLVPWIRLISPTGQLVTFNFSSVTALIERSLSETGTYRVIASSRDAGLDATGDYRITMALVPGDFEVPGDDEGGAMTNGVNHTGSLHIGDIDQWSFDAEAGDYAAISMAEVGGDGDLVPWIRLISPTGEFITFNFSSVTALIELNLPETGSYRIIASTRDGGLDGTGDYRITLALAPGAFEVSPGDEGGELPGGTTTGMLTPGDIDMWSFTAAEGDFISLSMAELEEGSDLVPWIRLISPTGEFVTFNFSAVTAQIELNLPESGTYLVIVSSRDGGLDAAGDYRLSFAR